ncbi:MAG: alanine--tRNA ligase-related protein [Verrucomicrobiae bacterium]|nr:alanine--tRNA ligase-related protein [Verrucomicrobiae bacterium]
MTSSQIRQSFLDFFQSKQHTIVPSSSLMPDSPNLLFTNAGMNQFVPIFLGQTPCPYQPGRAADTQKCIRAGGKHNDLEDVGLDTYHHTFFEMLGNWSFGDYFKKEAIEWAWELVVGKWKFPPARLYATVFCPYLGEPGWEKKWAIELEQVAALTLTSRTFIAPDPNASPFEVSDQEAALYWARQFIAAGLDPKTHIIPGNKKDNFWMMGETGPCGPCSELHVDLTPDGDTKGSLVNQGSAECIEIWNLVFIQFNAQPRGGDASSLKGGGSAPAADSATGAAQPLVEFVPLSQKHVDTGMGFERVTSIIQGTKKFTDFQNAKISNYETDIFRPIFDALERLSGKKYRSTLPGRSTAGGAPAPQAQIEQEKIDVAFRVIADHIRTLGFAIADGIQPGNTDRNYVLRRILRRAVRYGRTLDFREPFFYKLVDVLADTMGDVFPEIRARKQHVQAVIHTEEEAFNKTLDKGIALFNEEVEKLAGSAAVGLGGTGYQPVPSGNLPDGVPGATYTKRNLPHFEKPWAIYAVNFQTHGGRELTSAARDIAFDCILHWRESRYRLIATCVMPDHVHLIIQPGIKERATTGEPIFWSLTEILHSIKSFSAKEINKLDNTSGTLWQAERFDRYLRSDAELQEKFHYICKNPWTAKIVDERTPYRWLWTQDIEAAQPYIPPSSLPYASTTGQVAQPNRPVACSTQTTTSAPPSDGTSNLPAASPQISGAFAFRLYDEQGFPLDLTELMARERGLTVDTAGFEKLMEEQRARARAAQKKEVISLSQIQTTTPTKFVGYDTTATKAKVLEVVMEKGKTGLILDRSSFYAEMGGQVGDTGNVVKDSYGFIVTNTQKVGNTWVHWLEVNDADPALPQIGSEVDVLVNHDRRAAIQRHHTVTHLLHWALHEVVSQEATQKGSFVGPDKLTFDFNSAALTPAQIADIEQLVNERILENAGVSWTEVPFAEVKSRPDVMHLFGEKYGDTVRVVQIGGQVYKLDGYSMELCGGTHTRATGEIGLFRIVGENAIAAGVRRIEAVAGLTAYDVMRRDRELIKTVAGKINSPMHELEKKIEALLAQQKKLEKEIKTAMQRNASNAASELLGRAQTVNEIPFIAHNLGTADGDFLQAIADALKGRFKGVVVLGGYGENAVSLVATVTPEFTAKIQAGKIIQRIAPLVGGKGGGKPDHARGGGKDASQLDTALAQAKSLLG